MLSQNQLLGGGGGGTLVYILGWSLHYYHPNSQVLVVLGYHAAST